MKYVSRFSHGRQRIFANCFLGRCCFLGCCYLLYGVLLLALWYSYILQWSPRHDLSSCMSLLSTSMSIILITPEGI